MEEILIYICVVIHLAFVRTLQLNAIVLLLRVKEKIQKLYKIKQRQHNNKVHKHVNDKQE